MPSLATRLRRNLHAGHRRLRELQMIAKGLISTDHIVQAHIIPMRRCNLSCTYCNEYDDVSKPVDVNVMLGRVDHLASLGATLIMISGGEPLLHPELEKIIARIRHHGRIAGMITNGYLLMPDRIQRLNEAGLDHLQISIDNVMPDEVSKKSLKVLDKKLQMLAEHAEFHVNINSVLGGGTKVPEDALVIGRRALELGFSCTVGIIHDGHGQLKPLGEREFKVFREFKTLSQRSFAHFSGFQERVAAGQTSEWRCRAGSRYIYVCEEGLVHYCSQQRGFPGTPLLDYTVEDVRREFLTKKDCAPHCTISCVHMTSHMDYWRAPQTLESGLNNRKPEVEDLINIQGVGR
ncbi:MAG TPA: radical SAM protein [Bryobacteraceae bacterium]|nr:radical SAM protein [Bryobacteraceae bacterium]